MPAAGGYLVGPVSNHGTGHDIGMRLLQQFRCPSGLMGRFAGTAMAVTNTPLVRAVIAEVAAVDGEHILDIGFGPGVSLVLLARGAPGAVVCVSSGSRTFVFSSHT